MANQHFQIVIIGAGPAGMAAALTTTKAGLATIVIDDQKDSGGQVYRNLQANQETSPAYLGQSYYDGAKLAQSFAGCGAVYWPIVRFGKLLICMKSRLSLRAKPN